jgi:hypothetical protein
LLQQQQLQQKEKEREALAEINARQETRIERQQAKTNELIGFYLVFQGVILTSVAQGSALRCANWWLPFTLAAIAAAAIIMAVLHMLLKIALLKLELDKNRRHAERLDRLILRRKQQLLHHRHHRHHHHHHHRPHGDGADGDDGADADGYGGDADAGYVDDGDGGDGGDGGDHANVLSCLYRAAYPTLVLATLLTFTAFILVSCRRILCFPGLDPDHG